MPPCASDVNGFDTAYNISVSSVVFGSLLFVFVFVIGPYAIARDGRDSKAIQDLKDLTKG